MDRINYAFIKTQMYGKQHYCEVHVYNKKSLALDKMDLEVNKDIGVFVRDMGYTPVIKEEDDKITVIHCDKECLQMHIANDDDILETIYTVTEAVVHE